MTALEIIPLEDARIYLGMDDTVRDNEILRISKAAINHVESETRHILINRTKTYYLENRCVRVYDFPINGNVPANFTRAAKPGYFVYTADNDEAETLDLAVGYEDVDDIPADLVEACYVTLKALFDEEGGHKIPPSVDMLIREHKRFVV